MAWLVIFFVLAGIGLLWFQRQAGNKPEIASKTPEISPYGCVELEPLPPATEQTLVDATESIGLAFTHTVGPLGTYYMPESVGAGGAWHDFDDDGRLDLFLVGGEKSPDAPDFPEGTRTGNALYRMSENGTLIDVTEGSGLGHLGYGMGCAVGDVDNDGDADLYVTTVGQDRLLMNVGHMRFEDVTTAAGFSETEWGTGAAFFDYDRDGRLDLVVSNYTRDDKYGHSVACGFREGLVSYCGPHKFSQTTDRLYHNEGPLTDSLSGVESPRFRDVTVESGLAAATTYGFTTVCADFTGDRWPDIFIANDGQPNRLWVNQKDGTFLDEGLQRGVAVNGAGSAEAGMGVAVGDVDRNGALDLVVSHLSGETTTLYLNDGSGRFDDRTKAMNVAEPTIRHTGWGAALVDLDHDGWLDLPLVHGLVIPCHSRFAPHGEDVFHKRQEQIADPSRYWRDYADRNSLLMLNAAQRFSNDSISHGGDFSRAIGSGRALISGDPDEDGDLDLLVTYSGSPCRYYRNDFVKQGHWLRVRAIDPALMRDAIGAKITIEAGNLSLTGGIVPCSSFLANHDVRLHFGVGSLTQYDRVIVEWPNGPVETCVEEFPGGKTDTSLLIERGRGTPR